MVMLPWVVAMVTEDPPPPSKELNLFLNRHISSYCFILRIFFKFRAGHRGSTILESNIIILKSTLSNKRPPS